MDLSSRYNPPRFFATTCSLLVMMTVAFRGKTTQDDDCDECKTQDLHLCFENTAIHVMGGNLTAVVGDTVVIPCKMTDDVETLTQISWTRTTRKYPGNNFFFTISEKNGASFVNGPDARITFFGNFAARNGTLQISNVSLSDEGTFSCIFTLFPSGNHKTDIPLQLLIPPSTILNHDPLVLGNEEVLLATCTAAGARPPAKVRWLDLEKGFVERTNSTKQADGTTTTVSALFGVPTKEISGRKVQCLVSSPALSRNQLQSSALHVFFSPMNVTILERSDRTIECISEGNPKPDFTWTRSGETLPDSNFKVDGGNLTVVHCASHLKGFYQCEVSNSYGQKNQQVYLATCSERNLVPWVLFGLLLSLDVIIAAWYFYKYRQRTNDEAQRGSYMVTHEANSPEHPEMRDPGQPTPAEDSL